MKARGRCWRHLPQGGGEPLRNTTPLTLTSSGRGWAWGRQGFLRFPPAGRRFSSQQEIVGHAGGVSAVNLGDLGGWQCTSEEGDSVTAGDHGADGLARANGVRAQVGHVQLQAVHLPPQLCLCLRKCLVLNPVPLTVLKGVLSLSPSPQVPGPHLCPQLCPLPGPVLFPVSPPGLYLAGPLPTLPSFHLLRPQPLAGADAGWDPAGLRLQDQRSPAGVPLWQHQLHLPPHCSETRRHQRSHLGLHRVPANPSV